MSTDRVYCATGHRPPSFGGYSKEVERDLYDFAVDWLRDEDVTVSADGDRMVMITGMALGWDRAVAEACVSLGIPFIAAVPGPDYGSVWRPHQIERHAELLEQAESVTVVCPYLDRVAMNKRNEWMVDRVDGGRVLALWNGGPSGTGKAVVYAMEKEPPVPVENRYREFIEFHRDRNIIRKGGIST